MRYLFKGGVLNSKSAFDLLNSNVFAPRVVQVVFLSIVSSKSVHNGKKVDKNPNFQDTRESQGLGPLFNEIVGILGAENVGVDNHAPYGFLMSKETGLKGNKGSVDSSLCQLEGVCENAEERRDHAKVGSSLVLESNGGGISGELEVKDVSPIVHKVTEIVRGENGAVKMEERLENAGLEYNVDVVEMVLKRCFKVPHLALRFFNWVKLRDRFRHTANIYNIMIDMAGEAGQFSLVEELLEEMKKSSCEKNVKTWTVLISHYGKAKLIGKALLAFEEMKRAGFEPDEIAYKKMLNGLCNAGKADIALELYKDILRNEVRLDVGTYKNLLKCFALSGDIGSVHFVGENMIRLSEIEESQVYGLMLKSLCVAGRIRESLELIRELKNKKIILDSSFFKTLVKGLCSRDRITDAMEIFEIMKKRNVLDPNVYGILISGYLRRNEISVALNLFEEAKKHGRISVSLYTNLMQHFFWKNEFHKGLELYNEMLATGIQLDSVAITAVAAGYIRQNCISEAWKVFKSMDERGIKPTSKSYAIFIKELRNSSKTDEIVKILNEMQVCKVNIRDSIFEQVLSYLKKKGDVELVDAIMRLQKGYTFHPKGEEELNDVQCKEPEVIGKLELNQIPEERFPDCNLDLKEVCQILSSSTDWCFIEEKLEKVYLQFTPDLVVEILRSCGLNIGTALKFFTWVRKKPGYSHNEQSYNMAMKIAGQGKNFKEMRTLFHEMRRRGFSITSDTWTINIMQYGRTGLTDIALTIFSEMKLSGCKPNKSTYHSLITSLCGKKGRKTDEAIKIYHEMVQSGFAPDKELVETYLGCLCEENKLSDAKICVKSLHKFGFSIPLSYSLYFRALCRAGKLEHALALNDELGSEKDILDKYTYGSLIHALLMRGRLEEAFDKIKRMKQIDIHPTVHVYTSLIIYFLKERQINKALEILEEMKGQGCQPTLVTYSALICGYVRLGRSNDAWNVFNRLKQNGPLPDFKTYSMFIDCLCKTGKSEEAMKLISEMMDAGIIPSAINFRNIIYGLNREGKPSLARAVLKKKLDLKRRRSMHLQ